MVLSGLTFELSGCEAVRLSNGLGVIAPMDGLVDLLEIPIEASQRVFEIASAKHYLSIAGQELVVLNILTQGRAVSRSVLRESSISMDNKIS